MQPNTLNVQAKRTISRALLAFGVIAALNARCVETDSVTATNAVSSASAMLPGHGLAQHPFLYTGEWDNRKTNQTLDWCPGGIRDSKRWPGSVQVLEVTPEKKVIWALSEWQDPDLGPVSSIQLLDESGAPENPGDLQR